MSTLDDSFSRVALGKWYHSKLWQFRATWNHSKWMPWTNLACLTNIHATSHLLLALRLAMKFQNEYGSNHRPSNCINVLFLLMNLYCMESTVLANWNETLVNQRYVCKWGHFERANTTLKMLLASWFLLYFIKRFRYFSAENFGFVD